MVVLNSYGLGAKAEQSLVNSHFTVLDYRLDRGVIGDITLQEIRVRHERTQKGFDGVKKQLAYGEVCVAVMNLA